MSKNVILSFSARTRGVYTCSEERDIYESDKTAAASYSVVVFPFFYFPKIYIYIYNEVQSKKKKNTHIILYRIRVCERANK